MSTNTYNRVIKNLSTVHDRFFVFCYCVCVCGKCPLRGSGKALEAESQWSIVCREAASHGPSHAAAGHLRGVAAPALRALDRLVDRENEASRLAGRGQSVDLDDCRLPDAALQVVGDVLVVYVNAVPAFARVMLLPELVENVGRVEARVVAQLPATEIPPPNLMETTIARATIFYCTLPIADGILILRKMGIFFVQYAPIWGIPRKCDFSCSELKNVTGDQTG